MHIFFSDQPGDRQFILDATESNHLARVLRLREGDPVYVINGNGNLYECRVASSDNRNAVVEIVSVKNNWDQRNYSLHIAIAPTKNMERFEFFVEKAVELGVDEITPLITRRTERKVFRKDRVEKIIVSAMKQSLKAKKTILNSPVAIADFLNLPLKGQGFIAHCIDAMDVSGINEIYTPGENVTIMIGPEGDFSAEEVTEATGKGYQPVTMGDSRLRTETAGIVACSFIYFMNLRSGNRG